MFLRKKITLTLFSAASILSLLSLSSSCDKKISNAEVMNISLISPWMEDEDKPEKIRLELENKLQEIIGEKVKIKVTYASDDYLVNLQNISKGVIDLTFISHSSYENYINQDKTKANKIKPLIQTLTKSFKYDNEKFSYVDGTKNDKIITNAKLQSNLFNQEKYSEWNYPWNGSIYELFYDDKLVDFQRGIIWISGTDEVRNEIVNAWNNKDWNKFRSFGIVHGSADSGSKYLLPEKLLKQHFNLKNNSFVSLAYEITNYSNYFLNGKTKDMLKNNSFHICFDNEGSYSWTKNTIDNISKYTPMENEKMEILALTDPLQYNIAVVNNKKVNEEIQEIITNAFIQLYSSNNDNWGPTVGFYGYTKYEK